MGTLMPTKDKAGQTGAGNESSGRSSKELKKSSVFIFNFQILSSF